MVMSVVSLVGIENEAQKIKPLWSTKNKTKNKAIYNIWNDRYIAP